MKSHLIYLMALTFILLPLSIYVFFVKEINLIHLVYLITTLALSITVLLYTVSKNGVPRSSAIIISSIITYLYGLVSTIVIVTLLPTPKTILFLFVLYLLTSIFLYSFGLYSISILPTTTRIDE